ncbi:MAG: radical SAM protein [Oligoflexia bacterium]|nr:radical SAM protein [Oligoflexia bacterium]
MLNIVLFDISNENFGVQILTAILKKAGHIVNVIYHPADPITLNNNYLSKNIIDQFANEIIAEKPDIVGFSAFTDTFKLCCQIAAKIKEKNCHIKTLFGGIHTTLTMGKIIEKEFIDFVILGEAENAIVEFLEEFEKDRNYRKVQNLVYKNEGQIHINQCRPYLRNLDSLPFADKDAYFQKNKNVGYQYLLVSSRGCPFCCTYCSTNATRKLYPLEKNHFRKRSVENVIEELKYAKLKYKPKVIRFFDDIFVSDFDWLSKFKDIYLKEINLELSCMVHVKYLKKNTIRLLKDIGVRMVDMGLQTANETYRKKYLNRWEKNDEVKQAIEILRDNGIKTSLHHILGLPGDDIKSIENSIKTYSTWSPGYFIDVYWLNYYPNIEIIDTAKQMGLLTAQDETLITDGEYNINYAQFDPRRFDNDYIKCAIYLHLLGILPGKHVRWLLKYKKFIIPSNLLLKIFSFISRVVVNRQTWTLGLLKLILLNKIRQWFSATNNKINFCCNFWKIVPKRNKGEIKNLLDQPVK